jgi:hypothetical protein
LEAPVGSPYRVGQPEQIGSDDKEAHCTRLVLAVYTAVMASSRNERGAFDAAVETYRTEKSDMPEEDARRAVAQIICRKT